MHSQIYREKTQAESGGLHVQASYVLSIPSDNTELTLSLAMKMMQTVGSVSAQWSALETKCPQLLMGDGHIGVLHSTQQNSRCPEGKHMYGINFLATV